MNHWRAGIFFPLVIADLTSPRTALATRRTGPLALAPLDTGAEEKAAAAAAPVAGVWGAPCATAVAGSAPGRIAFVVVAAAGEIGIGSFSA